MNNVAILSIVSLLTDISSEMLYPIIPIYLSMMGTSVLYLGIMEGLVESIGNLLKLFFGMYSDKIRKRKGLVIFGYTLSSFGKMVLLAGNAYAIILFSRFLDRLGKGIRTSPRDALIAESTARDKRGAMFGMHRFFDTLGAVTGIIVVIAVVHYFKDDFNLIFTIALFPAFLAVILLFWVKDVRPRNKAAEGTSIKIFSSIKDIPSDLSRYYLFVFIFALGNSSNMFLILKALNVGFSTISVLVLYLLYNLSYCASVYPASKLSDTFGRKKFLAAGYILYSAVYLGFGLIDNMAAYWALFLVYGLYIGLTEGVEKAMITDLAPKDIKATALGLYSAIIGITLLPASVIAGYLWKSFGASTPFYFSAFTAFSASMLIYFFTNQKKNAPSEGV